MIEHDEISSPGVLISFFIKSEIHIVLLSLCWESLCDIHLTWEFTSASHIQFNIPTLIYTLYILIYFNLYIYTYIL